MLDLDAQRGPARRWRRLQAVAVGVLGLLSLASCKNDSPTQIGSDLRTPPDTLHAVELVATVADSVFPVPVSLGKSPVGQLGTRIAYTAHVLYAFEVPTVDSGDTLLLDTATLSIAVQAASAAPFAGNLRARLREVDPAARDWSTDSVLVALPPLLPATLAPDVVVAGADVDGEATTLSFELDLPSFADYDSVRAERDTLEVNVALTFVGFDDGGPGFLEINYRNSSNQPTATFNGFSNDEPANAIVTRTPLRRLAVVEYDSTYSAGTHFVVADGFRQHTYVKFAPVADVLPPDAVVYAADFVVTQVDSADGAVFGTGPALGVVVPTDTTAVFSTEQNTLALSFSASLVAVPGDDVSLNVTAYVLDQQEGSVDNSGMILRLSNEGTKVRHFEFYGARDPDPTRRPRIRILYALPADFGGGL